LLAAALYVTGAALAALPALHQWLHHDAASPEHQCAATVVAQGQVDAAVTTVSLAVPTVVAKQTCPVQVLRLVPPAFQRPPERAPPASLA